MENDAGTPQDPGQAPEQQAGGGPDPDAIAADLFDELAGGYGDEAEQGYDDEEYERPSIDELGREARQDSALWQQLGQEHPALWTHAATSAMEPVARKVAAEYGQQALNHPEVWREIYEYVGGDTAFSEALAHEDVANKYAGAFIEPAHDPETGKPLPSIDPLTGAPAHGQPTQSNNLLTS